MFLVRARKQKHPAHSDTSFLVFENCISMFDVCLQLQLSLMFIWRYGDVPIIEILIGE